MSCDEGRRRLSSSFTHIADAHLHKPRPSPDGPSLCLCLHWAAVQHRPGCTSGMQPLPSLRSVPSSFTPSPPSPPYPCILSLAHCAPPSTSFPSTLRLLPSLPFPLLPPVIIPPPSATFFSSFHTVPVFPCCLPAPIPSIEFRPPPSPRNLLSLLRLSQTILVKQQNVTLNSKLRKSGSVLTEHERLAQSGQTLTLLKIINRCIRWKASRTSRIRIFFASIWQRGRSKLF